MSQDLQKELTKVKKELEETRAELEANENLVRLAMDDMRKLYEDLIETQTQLMQADKMATVGILTVGIVHEINNPLMFVHGNVSLVKENAAADSPDGELLNQALEGVDRIMTIVKDIKTFSRSDQHQFVWEDLQTILESVIRIVSSQIKTKAELKKDYQAVPKVKCNPQQLSQVFLNLLVNAAQAIEMHGTITIKTYTQDSTAFVAIQDTGSGISETAKAKLFTPFFSTKDAGKGTGLGLYISADIIRKHEGEIRVESELGKGTTFIIALPVRKE